MRGGLLTIALSGLGGALGSSLRLALSLGALHGMGDAFLWPTLAANLLGSALIGWLSARPLSPQAQAFWMTGFCGGFTTFSLLSLEGLVLITQGDWGLCALYLAASLMGAIVAVHSGRRLAEAT